MFTYVQVKHEDAFNVLCATSINEVTCSLLVYASVKWTGKWISRGGMKVIYVIFTIKDKTILVQGPSGPVAKGQDNGDLPL